MFSLSEKASAREILACAKTFEANEALSKKDLEILQLRRLGELLAWSYEYNAYYKIHNKAYGEDMCLDVINDGINNDRVHMVPCANFTGQYWKMDKRISTFGFQLTNWWQGDYKCLSIAGEFEDEVRLKDCGAKGENLWSFLYSEDEQGYAELMPEGSEGTLILDLDYATPYLGFESDERSQWIMKKAQ